MAASIFRRASEIPRKASEIYWDVISVEPLHPRTVSMFLRNIIVTVPGGVGHDDILSVVTIKTELIRNPGQWKNLDEAEYATLKWVDWFNHLRLLEPIGDIPPAELEAGYWEKGSEENTELLKQPSLR